MAFSRKVGKAIEDTLNKRVTHNTRGFVANGTIGENFYFETLFAENQSFVPTYVENIADATGVFLGQGRWTNENDGNIKKLCVLVYVHQHVLKNINARAVSSNPALAFHVQVCVVAPKKATEIVSISGINKAIVAIGAKVFLRISQHTKF